MSMEAYILAEKHTLVVLGASSDQLFLIRTAQEMGLRVLALDQNEHSPGLAVADAYGVVSTRDVPAICRFLDEYKAQGQHIAGVLTMGSDIPDILAAVCAHTGTPSVSMQTAQWATNKLAMKERFRDQGIPIPWFAPVTTLAELETYVAQRGYPLILKPVDRSGSRGVFLLQEGCDLAELFQRSLDFSYSGQCMVEEFLPGLQISTETVMSEGQGYTPGFADRNYEWWDRFLPQIMENGGWVPSVLSSDERAQVEELVVKASLALGVTDGITKGDVVMTPEGPMMIEMAARLSGGDFSESLVPLGCGINYVRAAVSIAVGKKPNVAELQPQFHKAVANRYFIPPAGVLERIEGVEEVKKQPWVHKLEFWYKPGDEVPPPLSHAHRFGVFVVSGDTREEAEKRVAWVYHTIKIFMK